jgi:hypothetical protein
LKTACPYLGVFSGMSEEREKNGRRTRGELEKISAGIRFFSCFESPEMGVLLDQPGLFKNCPRKRVNLFWARAIICPLAVNIDQVSSPCH